MEKQTLVEGDNLNFFQDKEIEKIIKKEKLLFSDKIIKINRYNMSQERNIVVTDCAVYNLKKKSKIFNYNKFQIAFKRRIPLNIILGITISKLTDEFVIHGADNEYDYDYVSQTKKKVIAVISQAYLAFTKGKLNFCETNEKSMKCYVTSKKEKKSNPEFTRMDKNQLKDIDAYLAEKDLPPFGDYERLARTNTVFSKHKYAQEVKLEDFKIIKVLGRGSFGKVSLVQFFPTKEIYAMKSIKKDVLIEQEQIENTILEKNILQHLDHPLLCGLIFCFQTFERIYFVMPFLNGGELFQHLRNQRVFDEERVKFYGAQIGIALQYLHEKGIIYRDIKPENILMDEMGYLRLADFGMAKRLKNNEKATSFCGTPEYLAPEIITGIGHDYSADWWSFGILLYEMLCGLPPFYYHNIEKMYDQIKNAKLKFPQKIKLSDEAQDILIKLLEKNPKKRLGTKKGFDEIKEHLFFEGIDFNAILEKKIPAPFVPTITDSLDLRNFDKEFTSEEIGISYIPKKNMQNIQKNQNKFTDFNQ